MSKDKLITGKDFRHMLEEDIKRLKSEVIEGQKGVKDHETLLRVNRLLNSYLMHKQDLDSLFKARHYLRKTKMELAMVKFNNELFAELENLKYIEIKIDTL